LLGAVDIQGGMRLIIFKVTVAPLELLLPSKSETAYLLQLLVCTG